MPKIIESSLTLATHRGTPLTDTEVPMRTAPTAFEGITIVRRVKSSIFSMETTFVVARDGGTPAASR